MCVSITDGSWQGWVGVKKVGTEEGEGKDQKGTPSTMDPGCVPSSALKGFCPVSGHAP